MRKVAQSNNVYHQPALKQKLGFIILVTSSLIFPSFKGDPTILYNELYPQIQGNKESLREIKRV